ncbi:MAG: family 16 glycosylhydrolase, partial [Bacteroidaceae bacterium]|nr:family 16 glycosylhydrolase [Bacteroidaceae bacterium]
EVQCYTDRIENACVKDGRLVITGRKEKFLNPNYDPMSGDWRKKPQYCDYTSASLIGKNVRHFLFGRIEVRARLTPGNGYFPAIWTCGYNKGWPANGEIDIMEHYWMGDGKEVLTANFAVSKCDSKDAYATQWKSTFTPLAYYTGKDKDWLKKYHVWRMDWDEDSISLYVDDELRNRINIKEFRNLDGSIAFYNTQYMWLNLALKNFGQGIDDNQIFEVDYFRVYQPTRDVEIPTTVTNLRVEEVGDTWVRLAWTPATDNIGVYRYDVYTKAMGEGNYKASTADSTITITELVPNTTSIIYVRALDKAGNYSYYSKNGSLQQNGGIVVTTKCAWDVLKFR